MIKFSKRVTNEGTVIFTISFFEAKTNDSVTPKTIKWDLLDENREVVNDRYQVNITPASEIDIVLYGDDTSQDDGFIRYLSIFATYDSVQYGNDRPLNGQIKFLIEKWEETIAPTP